MPEITRITSEALQATIRRLLPSQQGFGQDLEASNVITPIIDLTPTAEGSALPEYLQTALAFGSQTAFDRSTAGTDVIINTPGFYRVFGATTSKTSSTGNVLSEFSMSDGLSSKVIWKVESDNASDINVYGTVFDFNVFLQSGESLSIRVTAGNNMSGSTRQIADVNGNLVDPSGYSSE